jgi:[acyl-carrier-protein] S-malonyltransferase
VRWVETVRRLRALGVGIMVEVGPGKVLTGLAKRIDPEMTCLNVDGPAGLETTVAALAAAPVQG